MKALSWMSALAVVVMLEEGVAMEHVPEGIHKDGVGRVVLGRPLPKEILPSDAKSRYVAGYHADAQPHEGFRLDAPPVTVFLDRGPFQRESRTRYVDPAEAGGFASRAVRAARGGAKVRMILVESADVKTAAGVGVGTDLKSLQSKYPDLQLSPVPPTFGRDECVARTRSLPEVFFYFKDCKAAEEGEGVVRILMLRE